MNDSFFRRVIEEVRLRLDLVLYDQELKVQESKRGSRRWLRNEEDLT